MKLEVTRWRYGAEAVLPTTLLYKYECEGEAITFWEAEAIKAGAMVASSANDDCKAKKKKKFRGVSPWRGRRHCECQG